MHAHALISLSRCLWALFVHYWLTEFLLSILQRNDHQESVRISVTYAVKHLPLRAMWLLTGESSDFIHFLFLLLEFDSIFLWKHLQMVACVRETSKLWSLFHDIHE